VSWKIGKNKIFGLWLFIIVRWLGDHPVPLRDRGGIFELSFANLGLIPRLRGILQVRMGRSNVGGYVFMSEKMEARCLVELENLDQVDPVQGAACREEAQELLADSSVTLKVRTAIADSLMQANQALSVKNVVSEDSY
jgi:hypothetical protein